MTEKVNLGIDWAITNWEVVAVAALVALQAVNKLTARWDEGEKHWATRALLLLTELLSVLTSKGWSTAAGPLKLPLTPRSGKRGSIFPPTPPVALVLLIGGALLPMSGNGCASSATWRADADRTIRVAHETAKAGWDTARRILHARCMDAGRRCAQQTDTQEVTECSAVLACRANRSNMLTAYQGTQKMLELASEALREYDLLATMYQDTFADPKPDTGISKRLLDAKRAETQERVNRAQRAAGELLRKLSAEGLDE